MHYAVLSASEIPSPSRIILQVSDIRKSRAFVILTTSMLVQMGLIGNILEESFGYTHDPC